MIASGEGMELTVAGLVFDAFEYLFKHVHTVRVSDQQHVVGQGAAGEVYMIQAPVGGQYQFAFFDGHRRVVC